MTQPAPPSPQQTWERPTLTCLLPTPLSKLVISPPPAAPGPGAAAGIGWSHWSCSPSPSLSRLVREFVAQNNTVQIKHVIQTLSQEFALSQHPHSRKGGLIGLAACSIALGKVGLSPGGTDTPVMALTLTRGPTGLCRPVFYCRSLHPKAARSCSLIPWPGPYPGRPTCRESLNLAPLKDLGCQVALGPGGLGAGLF